jgi:hypothetical protein
VPPKFAITRSRCAARGYVGDWPDGGDVCPDSGETRASDPDLEIQIPLAFNVAVCDTCEVPGKEGRCPSCGRELDAVEPNAAARARVKALRPLLSRADDLVNSFGQFPDPHIAVTAVQAISLVTDARLFDRARDLVHLSGRVGEFNFSDPAVIGRETRAKRSNGFLTRWSPCAMRQGCWPLIGHKVRWRNFQAPSLRLRLSEPGLWRRLST